MDADILEDFDAADVGLTQDEIDELLGDEEGETT